MVTRVRFSTPAFSYAGALSPIWSPMKLTDRNRAERQNRWIATNAGGTTFLRRRKVSSTLVVANFRSSDSSANCHPSAGHFNSVDKAALNRRDECRWNYISPKDEVAGFDSLPAPTNLWSRSSAVEREVSSPLVVAQVEAPYSGFTPIQQRPQPLLRQRPAFRQKGRSPQTSRRDVCAAAAWRDECWWDYIRKRPIDRVKSPAGLPRTLKRGIGYLSHTPLSLRSFLKADCWLCANATGSTLS